jgi:hypothetical protein
MNQAPTEEKSNPCKESFTRYKGKFDESSPYRRKILHKDHSHKKKNPA